MPASNFFSRFLHASALSSPRLRCNRLMLKNILAVAGIVAIVFIPAFESSIHLSADFTSRAATGDYATFRGQVLLTTRASLFDKISRARFDRNLSQIVFKVGVAEAIAHAGNYELSGHPEPLKTWGLSLESDCQRAAQSFLGGSWRARLVDGFELSPSHSPIESSDPGRA